jgi:hypothetical protein
LELNAEEETGIDEIPHMDTRYGFITNEFLSFDALLFIFEVNIIFVVKNHHRITDDCGVWVSGSSPPTSYINMPDETMKTVVEKKGEFYIRKKSKGNTNLVKLEPQPAESDVVTIKRYYATSKKDKNYNRRITSLNGKDFFPIVEYLGSFPGLSAHGNKKKNSEYIRTPAQVMSEMSSLLKEKEPHQCLTI